MIWSSSSSRRRRARGFVSKIDFPALIMSLVPDLVAYLDSELRYLYTNDAYQAVLQLSAAQLQGKTAFEVIPEHAQAVVIPKMRAALGGEEVEFDTELRLPEAPPRWVHVRHIPHRTGDTSVHGFFAILTDITARKAAELELQRVKELCDNLPTLLAHCDDDERYLYVNRAYAENYGRTKGEAIGKRVRDVVPATLYRQIGPQIGRLLDGEPVDFDAEIPNATGVATWMTVRGIPELSAARVVGFFVNVSDVSKHKELEELRNELTIAIVKAQEAERKALAQELHDGIAQELAAVAVLSNMLERDRAGAATPVVTSIQKGLHRTVAEVRRISYGLHPLELSERGLAGAIGEFLNRTRQAHGEIRIDLETAAFPDGASFGNDIDIAVYRIVQEAVSNALRHGESSRIELRIQHLEGQVTGTVTDDGKGFDVGSERHGLGLPSMRERAALLGGALSVASSNGGTSIEFSIPVPGPL